ncbi:MAG: PepSY domain-containing protein [Proteobacteria bacterium]|nr:PepSY domain-containing protein [Pseudomonadota bacterium]
MRTIAAVISALGLLGLSAGVALADPPDRRDHREGGRGEHHQGQGQPQQQPYRGGPPPQYHGPPQGQGYGYPGVRPGGRTVPLDGVVGQLRRRYPTGRLLDAEMQDQGGRPVYRVHWATGDGRRIDYLIDAQTGAVIGEEH